MIRPSLPEEVDTFVEIARATGMFSPAEVDSLREVYDDFFDDNCEDGDQCLTLLEDGKITGFTYFGPDNIAVGSWELWWIVVDKSVQGTGRGGQLLREAEKRAFEAQGRLMFIDTSSLPRYEPTRRFYLKHSYEQEAVLREYYAPGDDKVIYRRVLSAK